METKPQVGQTVFYSAYPFRIRELKVVKHDPYQEAYVYCQTAEDGRQDEEQQHFDCNWKCDLFPTYREAADALIGHHEFLISQIKSDRRYNQ